MFAVFEGVVLTYFLVINIVSAMTYSKEGIDPGRRTPLWKLLVPVLLGGGLGGVIGNYFFITCHKRLDCRGRLAVHALPGIVFWTVDMGVLFLFCPYFIDLVMPVLDLYGIVLIFINFLSFIMTTFITYMFFWVPAIKYDKPEKILKIIDAILIILGGAMGGILSRITFVYCWEESRKYLSGFLILILGIIQVYVLQYGIAGLLDYFSL